MVRNGCFREGSPWVCYSQEALRFVSIELDYLEVQSILTSYSTDIYCPVFLVTSFVGTEKIRPMSSARPMSQLPGKNNSRKKSVVYFPLLFLGNYASEAEHGNVTYKLIFNCLVFLRVVSWAIARPTDEIFFLLVLLSGPEYFLDAVALTSIHDNFN